ncbi:MAG: biotin--[Bacteroidales bacterium]|nr:biotin--[acetyl-CoA-carboxylase] ligase [Bacteroidales bacterium]
MAEAEMCPGTDNPGIKFDVIAFDRLESSNLFIMQNEGKHDFSEGTVVWAKSQTSGIGQSGNSWVSEDGKNLTFSVVLRPDFLPVAEQFALHKALSVAVCNTLRQILPQRNDIKIKWPNDIYVGTKKICGILVNNKISGNSYTLAVAGIGLNVNQTDFPASLPNPISLKNAAGHDFELFDVLEKILHNIGVWYNILKENQLNVLDEAYFGQMLNFGEKKTYRYHGTELQATITGVDRFGRLLLQTADNQSLVCDIKELTYIFQ